MSTELSTLREEESPGICTAALFGGYGGSRPAGRVHLDHNTPTEIEPAGLLHSQRRYAAERRNLDESIEELRQLGDGRNDILAEAAGIEAGSWYASPATQVGYELIGAGMLIIAGDGRGLPMDYDELERWTRVGYERGMRSRKGER